LQALGAAFFGCHVSLQKRGVRVFLHLQQVRNFQHAVAAAETFADALAFGKCIGHEFSGLDSLGDWGRADDQHLHVVLGPLATTSVGGRLRIARNPNQGSSAVSSEDTQQQVIHLLMGVL
jgi:hypothetical protein